MKPSEAQKQASKKWNTEKVDALHIRLKKGMREVVQNHAAGQNESVNAFVTRAIEETIKRDNQSAEMK
jgi:predicted HicB family RNase H-like nuclease